MNKRIVDINRYTLSISNRCLVLLFFFFFFWTDLSRPENDLRRSIRPAAGSFK